MSRWQSIGMWLWFAAMGVVTGLTLSLFERGHIVTGPAVVSGEEREGFERPDHFAGISIRQRRDAHHDVLEEFDENAPSATNHYGSEDRVVCDAHKHLDA